MTLRKMLVGWLWDSAIFSNIWHLEKNWGLTLTEYPVVANLASRRATEKIFVSVSVKGLTKGYVRDRKNFFQCEFLLQGGFLWPNKAF